MLALKSQVWLYMMSCTFAFSFNLSVVGCGGLNENCEHWRQVGCAVWKAKETLEGEALLEDKHCLKQALRVPSPASLSVHSLCVEDVISQPPASLGCCSPARPLAITVDSLFFTLTADRCTMRLNTRQLCLWTHALHNTGLLTTLSENREVDGAPHLPGDV